MLFEGSISSSAGFRAVAVSPAVSFVDANDVAQASTMYRLLSRVWNVAGNDSIFAFVDILRW